MRDPRKLPLPLLYENNKEKEIEKEQLVDVPKFIYFIEIPRFLHGRSFSWNLRPASRYQLYQ
jgi:hypothetical protein